MSSTNHAEQVLDGGGVDGGERIDLHAEQRVLRPKRHGGGGVVTSVVVVKVEEVNRRCCVRYYPAALRTSHALDAEVPKYIERVDLQAHRRSRPYIRTARLVTIQSV